MANEMPIESVGMKVITATLLPFYMVLEMWPFQEYISMPMAIVSAFFFLVLAWATSRLMDPRPYLYNNGELGKLERQSIFNKND
eukprot:CAMPEP_0172628780 /NCGR_PEP_ID=MMETSP1068-20121228/163812_1 /TAXON_ID=35684 /ORGANISM="Pseudopedinella elastica, Strain CCMP716" /LENGTH=83 /DNA_ID=CAMNT_0013439125 /DNA_START=94 /DNA_END=345 /DNA_ORIENTATION=+